MMALSFYSRAGVPAPYYYNSSPDALWLNKTGCTTPTAMLVANFTVSGDLRTTEKLMVTTTVVMTVLGAALFTLCLLARLSDRPRGHSTATRIFFRATFVLFLPFMSYMFSQARSKNALARADLILLWMLLVELLCKKVYAMVAPEGAAFAHDVGRYSFFDAVEEAARMVWIGYLVYVYVHHTATKSFFIILWVFSVAKLCKRASCIELAKRSFDLAKNASLVSGYMAHLACPGRDQQLLLLDNIAGGGSSVLSRCNYVVLGESEMTKKETPSGFRLPELDDIIAGQQAEAEVANAEAEATKPVRVPTVWRLAETDPVFQYNEDRKHKLQDTCLGLALFKLLRRKMERQSMAEAGTA
ncbi:hypothetical protein EJB05_06218, partial [Eragrostis curvula]